VDILLAQQAFVGVEWRFGTMGRRHTRNACVFCERLREIVNMRLNQEALEGEGHKHEQADDGSQRSPGALACCRSLPHSCIPLCQAILSGAARLPQLTEMVMIAQARSMRAA
jgi:hypothetical protein